MSSPTPTPVENKKGEVAELRGLLRNPAMKEPSKFKSVVEKVIAYMTLGVDVSPLFSDMIMATHTKDVVQKKMVYLYLGVYADQNAELALLTINTLQKDCQDDDPVIRGLALKSLCSLRVPKLVEYVLAPIRKSLVDSSPYVRRIAVIACAKLFNLDKEAFKQTDFVEQLYNKLNDPDSDVVINAIYALNEILVDEGGMAINKKIIYHLLNKLRDFHEWGQCVVLELIIKYQPGSDYELFDFLNILEDRLRHSNSAVVLAASKAFLHLTRTMPKVHADVYKRLKGNEFFENYLIFL
jgi:AP-4 complex subunit beta-1